MQQWPAWFLYPCLEFPKSYPLSLEWKFQLPAVYKSSMYDLIWAYFSNPLKLIICYVQGRYHSKWWRHSVKDRQDASSKSISSRKEIYTVSRKLKRINSMYQNEWITSWIEPFWKALFRRWHLSKKSEREDGTHHLGMRRKHKGSYWRVFCKVVMRTVLHF